MMKILETERLILRRFIRDDLDEIYRLVYADPLVKNSWSGITGTPAEIKERFPGSIFNPRGNSAIEPWRSKREGV